MMKKTLLLLLSAGFVLGAHLHPCCDFEVAGQRLELGCTIAAARRAEWAASAAAEEILPGAPELPEARMHVRLRLKKGTDNAPALSDALLRATPRYRPAGDGLGGGALLRRGERWGGLYGAAAGLPGKHPARLGQGRGAEPPAHGQARLRPGGLRLHSGGHGAAGDRRGAGDLVRRGGQFRHSVNVKQEACGYIHTPPVILR